MESSLQGLLTGEDTDVAMDTDTDVDDTATQIAQHSIARDTDVDIDTRNVESDSNQVVHNLPL